METTLTLQVVFSQIIICVVLLTASKSIHSSAAAAATIATTKEKKSDKFPEEVVRRVSAIPPATLH